MTKDEARAKAAKLLNLATNPGASVEEARSAAMACCKLLKARELLTGGNVAQSVPGAPASDGGVDWMAEYERKMRAVVERQRRNHAEAARKAAEEQHDAFSKQVARQAEELMRAQWVNSTRPFDFSSVFGVDGRTKPRAESSPLRVCDVCGTIRPITDKSKNWCNVCLEGV
jgi:hypothetical protein